MIFNAIFTHKKVLFLIQNVLVLNNSEGMINKKNQLIINYMDVYFF